MAAYNLSVPSGEVALVAATAKTVVKVQAPANQAIRILGIEFFGKGVSNTDTPIKVELSRITTDGGTATTVTPAANDDDQSMTAQGVYKAAYTVEPTTYGANMRTWEVHPQTGLMYMFPLGQEIIVKGGNIWGVRCTATQNQTVSCNLIVEE